MTKRHSTLRVTYEWTLETIDEHGDIVDNHFSDTLDGLPDGVTAFRQPGFDLGVVRDVWEIDYFTGQGDLICRSWTYVKPDGTLPAYTTEDGGRDDGGIAKLPKRIHDELAKAVNK